METGTAPKWMIGKPILVLSAPQPAAARSAFSDYYLMALGALLVGYAILGKTVAYIGVPPLYVGEMVYALGVIAFLSTRCGIASFASLPNLLLAILIGWGIMPNAALHQRRRVRRAARQHARPLWRVCVYRYGAVARETRAAAARDQVSSLPRGGAGAARALYRGDDQCTYSLSSGGRSYGRWPMQK